MHSAEYMHYILSSFTLVLLFFIYLGTGLFFFQDRTAENGGNALIKDPIFLDSNLGSVHATYPLWFSVTSYVK